MDIKLEFLKDFSLKPVDVVAPQRKKQVVKLPDTADIRVFSNGRIFPSVSFATANGIEYQNREVLPDGKFIINGNGIDIWSSKDWAMTEGLPQDLLFCAVIAKAEPKVDVWGSTNYEEDNSPKGSVYTQGAATFGKNSLLDMLADVYGVNWDNTDYVDMKISPEILAVENGVYHIPKKVMSGKHKGEATYVRRTNIVINPIIVEHVEEKKATTAPTKIAEAVPEEAPKLDQEPATAADTATTDAKATLFAVNDEPIGDAPPKAKDWSKDLGNLGNLNPDAN